MSLGRYTLLRLAVVIPVIVVMLALTFLLTHVLPANPAVLAAGPNPTPELIAAKEAELGLDRPLISQLGSYFADLARGDLGTSIQTGNSVASDLGKRLPATLLLITLGSILGAAAAIAMAIWTADRERGPRALAGRVYGGLGSAMPDYFIGLLVILLFYVVLAVAPAPLGQAGPTAPVITSHTGAYTIDALLNGNLSAFRTGLGHLVLPVLTLALAYTAAIFRVARAALEDARRAKYVDYALLMGCSQRYVSRRVLENALPPVLTMTGVIYGLLLGGAVIVETVFSWGGAGQYAVDAINKNDFFAIQAFVMVAAVFSVLVYLAVDLVHAVLDPRVRRAF